jgi:hypothetical protein
MLQRAGWALPRPFCIHIYFFKIKTFYVADADLQMQSLVSIVRMATVLEEFITEDHCSLVGKRTQCKGYS